jgi:NADH:quinone reductase (non-electrogenic)
MILDKIRTSMWRTRLTGLLGIEIPILGGAMQWLSLAPLVAAISNSGGLGVLSSATFPSKDDLRDEIRKTRALTDKPFGVNINLFPALRSYSVETVIDVCHEEGVRILETSGRSPEAYMKRIKDGSTIHIHKCARVRDGIKAETLGADVVTIVGFECGGHPSYEEVSTLILLPRLAGTVAIPVIAGGGFADGRGIMAALSLGAEGVVLGTRLIATEECPIHPDFKKAMVEADINSTTILLRSVKDHRRVFLNKAAQEVLEMESRGVALEEIYQKMAGQRSKEAYETGDILKGILPCGLATGLIKEVLPVRKVFEKILQEAEEIRHRWRM